MGQLNLAIVGIGNCASSLVQGLEHYEDADEPAPGLAHPSLGGYHVSDVDVVCGFDVDERKVGRDVGEAAFADPNTATRALDEAPTLDAPVHMAPVADGVPGSVRGEDGVQVADRAPVDPATKLDEHDVDVLVTLLPPGSNKATEQWMQACLETGTAAVNAGPVAVAGDEAWGDRFREAGVPVLGDDVTGQAGATSTHRAIAEALEARGIDPERTYQLNVGGGTGKRATQDRGRRETASRGPREAVQGSLDERLDEGQIKAGPSDFVPFLGDDKVAFVRLEGQGFLASPVELELRLSVEDAPNAAGTLLDALRCAKLGADDGRAGPLEAPSSAFFKAPPSPVPEHEAIDRLESFLERATG